MRSELVPCKCGHDPQAEHTDEYVREHPHLGPCIAFRCAVEGCECESYRPDFDAVVVA